MKAATLHDYMQAHLPLHTVSHVALQQPLKFNTFQAHIDPEYKWESLE